MNDMLQCARDEAEKQGRAPGDAARVGMRSCDSLVDNSCFEVVHDGVGLVHIILRRLCPVHKIKGRIRSTPDAGRAACTS